MKPQYDYKNVDWKQVKKEWDDYPLHFDLKINHGNNMLSFQPFIDSTKRCRLMGYVNGRWEGLSSRDDHPYQKYLNRKIISPSREIIAWNRLADPKCRKMTDKQVIQRKGLKSGQYFTPYFDNIAQIKKMVTALE